MGQQPNIHVADGEKPRPVPQPPAAVRWRPVRPGMITAPGQVPHGGHFGNIGPDPGYALHILNLAELPDDDPDLRPVLAALMTSRAAALGRGPIREDLDAALVLCGYGYEAKAEVVERRERWKNAIHHDIRPGESAVSDVDIDLLIRKPEQIRWALGHSGDAKSER